MSGCPSQGQLASYVQSTCDEEDAVAIGMHVEQCERCRQWVEEANHTDGMLAGLRQVLDIEARPVSSADSSSAPTVLQPAARSLEAGATGGVRHAIEGYEILQELGRGGMGVVYLARQTSTKRDVALKLLLEGPFASESAKRRFEREVELAAQLDHPHIVNILESGIASGRYYFAMRYVSGLRLDDYLADRNLPPDEILRLFGRICQAVNYAHQRGVIHRDLKPSNILIDEHGDPHILDFGLAKISEPDGPGGAATLLSMPGQVMGTLPYMSPEQAAGVHHDMDIRSDVYSLGVILYEMLTGRFPYAVTGKLQDILRNITDAPATRPSALRPRIGHEVETIVLTALAKERERRYQSAGNFARDIERYLRGDPIDAKGDRTLYVLGKMVRRHRVPLGVAAVFLVLVGTSTVLLLNQRARLQRAAAEDILTLFMQDPAAALSRAGEAPPGVKADLIRSSARCVVSPAAPQRVMGARSTVFLDPQAFWTSIDGGPLWQSGEWLELCTLAGPPRDQLVPALSDRAAHGTDRQKYVAFCLLGQIAAPGPELVDLCRRTAESSPQPGVAMAAAWAGRRLGQQMPLTTGERIFVDEHAQLTFVSIPGCEAFRRGSPPGDPDRLPDEVPPPDAARIAPFYLAATETTLAKIPQLLDDPTYRDLLGDDVFGKDMAERLQELLDSSSAEQPSRVGLGYVSRVLARLYCDWLTEGGKALSPPRRYRLPTEDEWEYACRAGSTGRFCFGNDAAYARHFAHCDGSAARLHLVAQRMPNWFGLFDMHGGLWEPCDSRYPMEFVDDPAALGQDLWVQRGGAFYSPAVRCRSAQRNYSTPNAGFDSHGLRLVMELIEP